MPTYPRFIASRIATALSDRPVVLVVGARQSGKTTLVRELVPEAEYHSLDDARVRGVAASDPDGFVAGLGDRAIIDEVHRVPELLLSIKSAIDRHRVAGRFLLTGSADVLTLPTVADTLAGRIEIHRLRPLARAELAGADGSFIDVLFDGPTPSPGTLSRPAIIDTVVRGGFPEAITASGSEREFDWFASYLDTIVHRDFRDIASLRHVTEVPRLLSLIAAAAPGHLNITALSSATGIPRSSIDRYIIVLLQVFAVTHLPPWHANIGTRQIKAPRFMLADTGLMAHLLSEDRESLARISTNSLGRLVETLVGNELLAHLGWSRQRARLHWWRTVKGAEVDFVVEGRGGRLAGVEVKASGTVRLDDFRHLRRLKQATGERFARGIVLYTGDDVVPAGPDLAAWPLSTMWQGKTLHPAPGHPGSDAPR